MNGPPQQLTPPFSYALKRMREIFDDPSHSQDAMKFPSHEELEELRSEYSLTSKQITQHFAKMRDAERKRKKYKSQTKTPHPAILALATTTAGGGYPFHDFTLKPTNISVEGSTRRTSPRRQAIKCRCFSEGKICVAGYSSFFEKDGVTCKNAVWFDLFSSASCHDYSIEAK